MTKRTFSPDKINMINVVWTTLIASMLFTTVSLYNEDQRPQATSKYHQVADSQVKRSGFSIH